MSLKELTLREREVSNGGSISKISSEPRRVHIPKDLVPNFVVGDNWFKAYEAALEMHRIPKEDWGLAYGSICPPQVEIHSLA
mgnify:CR=1 FL=1